VTPTLFDTLVDIPQMTLSWVTFAEGCTVFHLSTSESDPLSQNQQRHTWMGTLQRHLARGGTLLNRPIRNILKHHSPGGATIGYVCLGSPICSGKYQYHFYKKRCYFIYVELNLEQLGS